MNQKVVMFNLKKLDCEITAVSNGREAIEIFKSNKYDIVLMDIMLPEKNGYEITLEIREFEKINEVKDPVTIIALTANTYENDKEKCLSVGMNDYLSKPFSAQQLINTIEKYS
ncbi:MAG: response regulator [Draconibacterium sp.]|nr:response regulator [Draconibacterium sp.]